MLLFKEKEQFRMKIGINVSLCYKASPLTLMLQCNFWGWWQTGCWYRQYRAAGASLTKRWQSNTCMNSYIEHITLSVICVYPSQLLFPPSYVCDFPAIYLCYNLGSLSLPTMSSLISIFSLSASCHSYHLEPQKTYVYVTPEPISLFQILYSNLLYISQRSENEQVLK